MIYLSETRVQALPMPRLNFTSRRRISKNHVTISVTGIGGIETFSAELELGSYGFPDSATVIIEAFRQLELVRFEFGTVGSLTPPASCRLSEFGTLAGLRFRIKVVSTAEPRGQLLAVGDRITPHNAEQQSLSRVPLLAVRAQDLGREVWRLDFADEPLLLVNPRVVAKKKLVQSVEFQSLVLPEILRSILSRILLVEQMRISDDSDEWTSRWLKFAESMPGVGTVPDEADPESDLDWIDAAISSFCRWRSVDQQFSGFWNARSVPEAPM
jgi:hypothetical protein